jgi:hypothetical protein
MSKLYNAWMSAKQIRNTKLIKEFELNLATEIVQKHYIAAWYPFREDFAVQWHNASYFIVSYGGGQFNKFCIVGLNKEKNALKCRSSKNCNNPRHQGHVKLVEKLMKNNNLIINNKQITNNDNNNLTSSSIPSSLPTSLSLIIFPKPLSTTQVSLFPSTSAQAAFIQQLHDPFSIPMEFKPNSHPPHCKCKLTDGRLGSYKSMAEVLPGKANDYCKVWLLYNELHGRKQYYWRCMQNNPECDIYYNGAQDGLFVYSSTTIVSHIVLLDFIYQLITGKGASFAGFVTHKKMINCYCFGKTQPNYMQQNTFIKV